MTDISYSGQHLEIDGTEIDVRNPVEEVVQHKGIVIVLLDVPQDTVDNRNVIAYDQHGQRLWEIERPPNRVSDNPYMFIKSEGDTVLVKSWKGMWYAVDLDDGSVSAHQYTK